MSDSTSSAKHTAGPTPAQRLDGFIRLVTEFKALGWSEEKALALARIEFQASAIAKAQGGAV